jgi:hypothetical protein
MPFYVLPKTGFTIEHNRYPVKGEISHFLNYLVNGKFTVDNSTLSDELISHKKTQSVSITTRFSSCDKY